MTFPSTGRSLFCVTALAGLLLVAPATLSPGPAVVWAEPTELRTPIDVDVYLPGDKRNEKVSGKLLRWDEAGFTLRVGNDERTYTWTQITSGSAFVVRMRLIDRAKADDWLALGEFGWGLGAKDQARTALSTAARMDPSLKPKVDAILATAPGGATLAGGNQQPKAGNADAPAAADATAKDSSAGDDGAPSGTITDNRTAGTVPVQPGRKRGEKVEVTKYVPATPEQHAAAIERAKKLADRVREVVKVDLVELQTDHFIIFTDWDKREHKFITDNVEGAYRLVSRAFDMSPKDNVFIGKLPVFMFASRRSFEKFGAQIDDFPVPAGVVGYYHGNERGIGHMAMPKPDIDAANGDIKQAELQWAYVLTHEFVHAFVARYRSNTRIPRWLNEGTAELITQSRFKKPSARQFARMMATQGAPIGSIFDDDVMPGGEYYPVMMTLVEMLVNENRAKYIKLFNDIKDGMEPEDALRKHFNVDYAGLERAWRQYAKTVK